MRAASVGAVVWRELVEQLNVGGQGRSHMRPFEQIVAEDPSGGEAPRKDPVEHPRIVDTFSVIGSFSGEILVDIGNRRSVRVGAHRVVEQACEEGLGGARQSRADAGLDDAVASHKFSVWPYLGLIQRVCQGLHHPADTLARQHRVAVERNDEANRTQPLRIPYSDTVLFDPRRGPHNQAVEVLELSSFALPTDELAFCLSPLS